MHVSMTASIAAAPAVTRLLIVEDDRSSARLLQQLLESVDGPGFQVRHVETAAAACAVLEDRAADVVLLDLGLPDAHDLEALGSLTERITEIPVVILTGNGDERLAAEALNRGAEDYLVKGAIDSTELIRSIRYAIERHHTVRELVRVKRELETANVRLEQLTLLDPLTDLLNRRGLQRGLSEQTSRVHRLDSSVAALLIDLDDFKRINSIFGHAVGDVALKETARRLTSTVRGCDHVGRLGGDEFLLILPDTDPAAAVQVAERLRVAIATTMLQHSSGTLSLTASIAVLMLGTDTPSVDQLLSRMHELLSRGKSEGKNRVVFDHEKFDDTARRLRLQSDMCANLAQGKHLLTVRQPILRLSDEVPVAYEFLSRYSNGRFELPENFFRVCSERNMLSLVDHFCLRQAVSAAVQSPPDTRFHLNIFPSTLLSIPPEHVLETFPSPLPPDTFCLEISEQEILGDPSYLIPAVRELRAAGLMVAIDDVGYGSSCLESLVVLEPEIMKIDKRCVMGLAGDRAKQDQLRRYVGIARALGSTVIAEGVENAQDLNALGDLGIEFAQGYYWGQPA